jgi:hypothetical protein
LAWGHENIMPLFPLMTRNFFTLLLLFFPAMPVTAKPTFLPPPVIPQCVGANIHFTGHPQKDLDGLESTGVGWVRMDFSWSDVEKTKGIYDFSAYDSLLEGLTARHIRPLFILDYSNPLYAPGPPVTLEARVAFARFAAASAAHYRGKAILWELWNEPNGRFWPPKADAAQYGAMALAAAHAIHVADPDATVIAPGTSGIPLDYLQPLFQMGLLNEIDAVSVHPYRTEAPETALADDLALRLLIHQYAPRGKDIPVIWSEWGYTSVGVSETQQAQYLAREWLCALSDGVRLSIWYDWHDDGLDPANTEDHFGMVHTDYSPKPAYLAARTLTQTLAGYRFIKRIPLESPDDFLLLFTHGPKNISLVAWTDGAAHEILLPISQVSALTSMTGDVLTPLFDQGRLRLPLSGSPLYADIPHDGALEQAGAWTATPDDPFYQASQPLHWGLVYHNPDTVAHRVHFEALMLTEGGGRTPIPGGTDNVSPGQTLRLGMASSLLARVPVRVRVGMKIDGVLQPYPQDMVFTPTDPVTLTVTTLASGETHLEITDPNGEAFSGSLNGIGNKPLGPLPIRLTTGQTALSLTLSAPAGTVWHLTDAQGRMLVTVPAKSQP